MEARIISSILDSVVSAFFFNHFTIPYIVNAMTIPAKKMIIARKFPEIPNISVGTNRVEFGPVSLFIMSILIFANRKYLVRNGYRKRNF